MRTNDVMKRLFLGDAIERDMATNSFSVVGPDRARISYAMFKSLWRQRLVTRTGANSGKEFYRPTPLAVERAERLRP